MSKEKTKHDYEKKTIRLGFEFLIKSKEEEGEKLKLVTLGKNS